MKGVSGKLKGMIVSLVIDEYNNNTLVKTNNSCIYAHLMIVNQINDLKLYLMAIIRLQT